MDKAKKLTKIISFRITENEYEKLQTVIKKKRINKSDAIRKIIAENYTN